MILQDLLLLGGGHSHLFVLEAFAMRPVEGLRLTLVSEESYAPYSGMLPGLVAGHYDFEESHIDLRRLADFAEARFIKAKVVGLDPRTQRVLLQDRPPLAYDLCSINLGAAPAPDGTAIPVKPVARFLAWLNALKPPARLAVVGAGAGGVELVLALAERYPDRQAVGLTLVERAPDILPGFPAKARQAMREALARAAVDVRAGAQEADASCDQRILTTGVAPPSWLADSGLTLGQGGFIAVDEALRSLSHPLVFAAGDVATQAGVARPKAGVFAVRQGPVLAENLQRQALGRPLASYRPQARYLTLLSQGGRRAVAVRNGLTLSGGWVWRWKARIDRRFMARFSDLPVMAEGRRAPLQRRENEPGQPPAMSAAAMRCAGCGAKVPGDVLERALSRLGSAALADPARRDDAHVVLPPPGHELVQSLDFFPALVSDPYLFGRIAAAHALNDLYAMGAEPLFALANAVLPPAAASVQEDELFQALSGAVATLGADGAELAGGHSSEGPGLALGFAVTGHLPAGKAIAKRGLEAGDALILTKPIGSGALFAAAMRRAAKASWLDGALAVMGRSNRTAAETFRRQGATALSDVSGFGLGGHLLEMLADSGLAARLDLAAIPRLAGFEAVLAAGIESSLAEANRRLLADKLDAAQADLGALVDPQTSGGLLAGVPEARAEETIAALRAGGDRQAAIIGRVIDNGPNAPPLLLSRQSAEAGFR